MAYPILAPQNTWWAPTVSTVTRSIITEIEIMDSYVPDSSVTVVNSWDASAAKDGSVMCYVIGTKLIIAGNGSGKIAANEDSSHFASDTYTDLFKKCNSITGLTLIDTSQTVSLSYFFYGFESITNFDLRSFNVQNVTDMSSMFKQCKALESLNVSGWNTSSVTNMSYMFQTAGSGQLEIIGFEQCDTSNVTNCQGMFYYASLKSIPWFNTQSVENMSMMFMFYVGTSIVCPNWDTSKVKTMQEMFGRHEETIVTSIDISNFNFDSVENCANMFLNGYGNDQLQEINLGKFILPKCTTIANIFKGCSKLKTIVCEEFSLYKVTSCKAMFQECSALTNIDTSKWNTSSCTDMQFMFYGCSSLGEIDVSNWDVSKVKNFDHFAAHANLKRKGIQNWKTTSATNMNALFHNCAEEELDLSGWDVSKNQFFCQMFENSPNLKRVKGLNKWNTSSGLGFDEMFGRCSKLEEVDLSSFNTTKAKNNVKASANNHKTATLKDMFVSCNNLKKVVVGPNFSINGDGTNTAAANKLILPTPSSSYIAGADGKWYIISGDSYAPNAIPDKTPNTYYASFDIVANLDVTVKNGSLIDTARAIREKSGDTGRYRPSEFGARIRSL